MNSFGLTIVGCRRILFQGRATSCGVVTAEGSQGLEAHHEDLLAVLRAPSRLVYRTEAGDDRELEVQAGLLSFVRNECRIIVQAE
jgi:F0F1-type ATP synthase epsilon subunit